ncbi:hypothetical protein K458DRAFT_439670 [Lentithecium fluviatile CBS 122367]|uniref:Uncharacterized protein n=1 Tax=Lentithecium fluviatile CBS 122367 TaxID=1168545 RepID=A0A6G1JFT4_9PLEO|nr:hypothetical protein K458DRAFT_439670 [Lentithecium fluviatile CBS 122367]
MENTATPSPAAIRDATPHQQQDPYWPVLATKDDIPAWLQNNEYIITGHPIPANSYKLSFHLWRCLHMETMDIWTHSTGMKTGNAFAFGIFLSSAALCFALSAAFYTLRSHSYKVTYYIFYCDPTLQRVYWTLNTSAAIASATSLFSTGGGGSKMRTLRGSVFSVLATTAMLPVFHGLVLLLGVSGGVDVWGHSHQLFHIGAVVGTFLQVRALATGFEFRQLDPSCSMEGVREVSEKEFSESVASS